MKASTSKRYIEVNWNQFQLTFFVFKRWQKKCWGCCSLDVIRWGKRNGHQRYKCNSCGLLFTWANKGVKQSNEFIWFTKWVLGRRTLNDLVIESRYSKSTLQRLFKVYLSKPPRFIIRYKTGLRLIIDGTYFSRELCLILYYDSAHRYPLYFRYSTNEFYKELKEDLQILSLLELKCSQ